MTEVVFITGAQWVPFRFFVKFYAHKIKQAFDDGAHFVLGAADGVDKMAQDWLRELCAPKCDFARVTVYDKGNRDGRRDDRFQLQHGFASYPDRDEAMFAASTQRILCLPQYGGACSGVMLTLLLEEFDGDYKRASALLTKIRKASEPFDQKEVDECIAPLYESKYNV